MLFSSLVETLNTKYPGSVSGVPLDCEISDVVLYDESRTAFSSDCLYVFTVGQLSCADALPLNLVCVGRADESACGKIEAVDTNYIMLPDATSAEAVCYILSLFGNTLKQQKLYSDLIYMLLLGEDLFSIFSTFEKETGCPVLAIDISGKVLAYSKPFRVNHPHWQHSVEVGYLDKYLIEYILSYRVKHNMSISPQPFVLFCDRLKLFIKTIRVISGGEVIGYVFIGSSSGEFPEFCDRFMSLIAKRLLNTLVGSRGYNSYRFNMHKNILSDMINGAREEESIQRISVANLTFPPYMMAAVLKPSYFRENDFLSEVLMPALSEILPDAPKFYQKGTVVALLETGKHGDIPEELRSGLKKLAEENSVLVGVSNMFTRPERFAVYYRQAAQAVSFAKRQNHVNGIFHYSDYAFYALLDDVEDKTMLEYARHPLLAELERYDEEKNTRLYETLMTYALTGFSKNKTAELVFLHRNTVNYRIQQISELYGLDFTDSALLFKLQYSFHIDSYLKHSYFSPRELSSAEKPT